MYFEKGDPVNEKRLAEFHETVYAGLGVLRDSADNDDDPEEVQVLHVFTSCNQFGKLIRIGLDDLLVETGNGPIHSSGDPKAETSRTVKMTVKELHTALYTATAVGVDLGVAMIRQGAKFPGAKPS